MSNYYQPSGGDGAFQWTNNFVVASSEDNDGSGGSSVPGSHSYNSTAQHDDSSHRMSRWGATQHVHSIMQPQYHHQQQQNYLGHHPPIYQHQHPPLNQHQPPLPIFMHDFAPTVHNNNLDYEQRRQTVIPAPPPLPPPLPPPPPPEEDPSHPTDSPVNESTASNNRDSLRPPHPTQPVFPTSIRDPNNDIDKAVDALNALSNLEQRWSAPPPPAMTTEKRQQQQQQATGAKNAKRKKRRRKNKKKDETVNNTGGGSSSEDRVILRDTGEWIDVEDATPTNNVPQHPALDLSTSGEPTDCTSLSNGDPRMISLAHDFPPLTSTFLEDGNPRVDPLASYASILQRSLEMNDDGANDSMKQAAQFFDDHDEMDISDDDNEVQLTQDNKACDGEDGTSATHELSSDATANDDDFPSTTLHQTQEMHVMEKRALKLAELKAKAKLAKAKLRLAEEKKARGQRAMELSDSTGVGASRPATSPLPDSLPDVNAARDESPLDEDIMRSAPGDDVRFVNSEAQATTSTHHATLASEEKGMKAKSLKQKLHLARLKLEIKKKELEKKELEMKKQSHSSRGIDEIEASHPPGISLNVDAAAEHSSSEQSKVRDKKALGAKLEHLRQRQKELQQQNDSANLRHLIHRQRGLLQAQRQELIEISSQLRACTDALASQQELLEQSESRVEEMKHRKKIIEGMGLRATEQLVAARKKLSERRKER
jgi:hypothetical protein